MPLPRLTLETLAMLLDGSIGEQGLRIIDTIRQDIIRRPGVKRKRKMRIELGFEAKNLIEIDPDSGVAVPILCGTGLSIDFYEVLPPRKSIEIDLGITEEGFFFNPDSPHDHRQRVLPGVFREADVKAPQD